MNKKNVVNLQCQFLMFRIEHKALRGAVVFLSFDDFVHERLLVALMATAATNVTKLRHLDEQSTWHDDAKKDAPPPLCF